MNNTQIRASRKRLKLSQEQFARALGVSCATVNRWENGHAVPLPDAIRRIKALANPNLTTVIYDKTKFKLVPLEPPDTIPNSRDTYAADLFGLCRADDYRGLYQALIARV